MDNEIVKQNKNYFLELNRYTTQEKVNWIDVANLEQTFRTRYKNQIFLNFFERLKQMPRMNFQQLSKSFFEKAIPMKVEEFHLQLDFFVFYNAETLELKKYLSQLQDPKSREKAEKYLRFLKKNEKRWWQIDCMCEIAANNAQADEVIAPLVKAKLKIEFVNTASLDQQQTDLFVATDRAYLINLLSPKKRLKKQENGEDFLRYFDSEFYREPHIFTEFPKEKRTFHKVLKSWLINQVEVRKKILEWDEIPPSYQFIIDYANKLLPKTEPIPDSKVPVGKSEPIIEYPKQIFANEKAFLLFTFLMQYFKTQSTISFIFRTMAEKEKPQLILVNDTPFRNWFNQQGHAIQLNNHTKTYENAKNEDRIAAYNIAKKFIMNN